MIKVILADDQKMFIDGVKSFLEKEDNIEIVGEAKNGEEVIDLVDRLSVDVVVLDIEMPEMNGIETTKIIKKKYPDVKILILSMYNKNSFISEIRMLGANGYILKDKTKEKLVCAIHDVFQGQDHFGLDVLNQLNIKSKISAKKVVLTTRETEILCLIAEGLTTKEIAQNLHISEATVNTHRRNLLRKLGFPNEKFLVRYAIKHGYIDP